MRYDYYYSAKHDAHLQKLSEFKRKIHRPLIVDGKVYTEKTEAGQKPYTSYFGDLVKVCTKEEPDFKR